MPRGDHQQDDDNAPYMPNDADIEFAKAQIRKKWSPKEEERRRGANQNPPAELIEVVTRGPRKGEKPYFSVEV